MPVYAHAELERTGQRRIKQYYAAAAGSTTAETSDLGKADGRMDEAPWGLEVEEGISQKPFPHRNLGRRGCFGTSRSVVIRKTGPRKSAAGNI